MGGVIRDISDERVETVIVGDDWWKTIILYFFLNIARAIMMACLFPFMKRLGDKITFKESVIIVWGGLRGALALALALIVATDDLVTTEFSKRQKDLVLFHTVS